MMIFPRRRTILFLLIVWMKFTDSSRKSKRTRQHRTQAPAYDIFPSDTLPSDLQVTIYLLKGEPKIYYYWSLVNGPLATTIISCCSKVRWSMTLSQNNTTVNQSDKLDEEITTTVDMDTKYLTTVSGLYILKIIAEECDTYVHVYISTEPGGSQALQNAHHHRLRLQKRQRRKKLTIRWEASLVDPQGTEYCLTVNTKKSYKSLCSAQTDKFGIQPPRPPRQPAVASQTVISWQPTAEKQDHREKATSPLIFCVGRKTQYTVSNLKHGQTYHFDLFAINRQSNLTYPFGSTTIKFDGRIKPITLRDGVSTFANLKKLDGKAVFRYKIGKRRGNALNIFVMPCGALVYAEVSLKNKVIVSQKRIEKFDNIVVKAPPEGARYYIKILAINREDVSRTSGVEVLVTSKPIAKLSIPTMPLDTAVEEYKSLRKCDSVTIGWLPSPASNVGLYCIMVKEGKIREADDYGLPNQCGLENRVKKYADFALRYCKDISHNITQQVITEKINYLKPGKSYIVQVTVKKPKGKALSYDLLQVHTTRSCHKH